MSAIPEPKRPVRGDLASMAQALAQFAQQQFPLARPAEVRIAVLVPCYNEEAAVATVVADFRNSLPTARIFVYDNNSSDRTAEAPGQGACSAADVRRHRCRHLCAGRWRCDL
jgi:hypothetical protein